MHRLAHTFITMENQMPKYVLRPKEKVELTLQHCKQCHHTFVCTRETPADQCTRCRSRHWYLWKDDFDISLAVCEHCRKIYYLEQFEPERALLPQPKKRGRKPGKK
jgi:hypothetical protein